MSRRLPPTRVESKSISVATHHDVSVGQNRFGDCGSHPPRHDRADPAVERAEAWRDPLRSRGHVPHWPKVTDIHVAHSAAGLYPARSLEADCFAP